MPGHQMNICLFAVLIAVLSACSVDSPGNGTPDWFADSVPEAIVVPGGGIQSNPAPSGDVVYFNEPNHTAVESDIRMDPGIRYMQTVRRYMYVSGTALPDDSGFTDRYYHSVLFGVVAPDASVHYLTLPVDENNRFRGYLYFPKGGTNKVYAYRAWDEYLYPRTRGDASTVDEGWSTLLFYADVTESVPQEYTNILPTSQVNSGNQMIRDYTKRIIAAAGAVSDQERVMAVYNFLIDGDSGGKFVYTYYDDIYPGYLTETSWNAIFIASHFLKRRLGVCNDFSELFAAMVRSLGIPVRKVSGTDPSTGEGHMWNEVYFSGAWWWLDSTWANGYPSGRDAYAEWSANTTEKQVFLNQHDNTYTEGFKSVY